MPWENGEFREAAQPQVNVVDHPSHYTFSKFEVIDIIEAWQLGFHLGNAVKYIARAAWKGSLLEDLKKARWYLDREIQRLETVNDGARSKS